MYNEAKVHTVLIFARKTARRFLRIQADNHSCPISTPARDYKKALMRTTASAEQARKAKTTPFSVSLVIVTMMFHEV
jgi:hypothetical protein